MIELRQSAVFAKWLDNLRDVTARLRIAARLRRIEHGNFGDAKFVGDGIRELRVDYGPGYRVYFVQHGQEIVILLCGGDKRTQAADIARAKQLAKEL